MVTSVMQGTNRLRRGLIVAVIAVVAVFAVTTFQAHRRKQQSNATAEDNQHWKKARGLRASGKHTEAISEYEQALRTLSHNSGLRQELAHELQVVGNDHEAAAQLREVINIDKEGYGVDYDAEIHADLGRILERKVELPEALKEYCLAAEAHPDVYFYDAEVERLSKRLNLTPDECRKYVSSEEDEVPDRVVF
jgi:tetratricopeptide (TPR) repeat protein